MVSLHVGPVQKLDFPPNIPEQFMSQIPRRFRPAEAKRPITIHPNPPSEWSTCKFPIQTIDNQTQKTLDHTGTRARLFSPSNPDGARPGDILLCTFTTGEPFSGVCLSIKSRGPHTSVLLRNQLTRVGTEMAIKVFSPLVRSMEIVQKAAKRARRARLFYLREPRHDRGGVGKIVDGYLRQRSAVMGGRGAGNARRREGVRGGQRR